MRSLSTVVLLFHAVAAAQIGLRPGPVPPELRRYLELTDAQATRIQQLNSRFASYRLDKVNRQLTVQQELAEQMRQDPLDPTAIGLRHVELESIRRETEAEQARTITDIQALLTSAQRTRLDVLAQVLRQHDLACSAVAINLLPLPQPPPSSATVSPGSGPGSSAMPAGCPNPLVGFVFVPGLAAAR